MRRPLLIGAGFVLLLVSLSFAAVLVLTNTDAGRERVRRYAVEQLNSEMSGSAIIGNLDGNLLLGFSLGDVTILDASRTPVFSASRISGRYRTFDLLRKRIELSDVRVTRPSVLLERSADGKWNVSSLLSVDTVSSPVTNDLGWGDWVSISDVTIEGGDVVMRTPWHPDSTLTLADRDSAIAEALDGGRSRVERTPNGLQRVFVLREIDAKLPHVRLSQPDSAAIAIQIGTLRAIAEPFRSSGIIRDLAAKVRITEDSVTVRDLRVDLPASRVKGYASLAGAGNANVHVRAEPVAFADLRWLYPRLPSEGGGSLDLDLVRNSGSSDIIARRIDLRSGSATLTGNAGARVSDSVQIHDTNLSFTDVGASLIEELVPSVKLPRRGTFSGRAKLDGTFSGLTVDGDVAFSDARSGVSRVLASGEIGVADGFRARALRVRAAPLHMNHVSDIAGDIPLRGALTGRATIDGATGASWRVDGDITHSDRGSRSRLAGRARITPGRRTLIDADVRALPLSLVTVGRFAPRLELRGDVSGPARVRGHLGDLTLAATLSLPDGGSLNANGRLDLSGDEPGYDVTIALGAANASALSTRAPRTSLTGTINANGRGVAPATMRASLSAELSASSVDTLSVDTLQARIQTADGVATVDTFSARAAGIIALASGTIGLTDARSGDLNYSVRVDSLATLARWIGRDTGTVSPRPWRQARALAIARADSARVFEETRTERGAAGGIPPALVVDTIATMPRDSLAGMVETRGTLYGSIERFDLKGGATLRDVVARGGTVRSGDVEYAILSATTSARSVTANAALAGVEAEGFAFDSVSSRVTYSDSVTTAELVLRQDERNSYRLTGDLIRSGDTTNVVLRDLQLRFDSTVWRSTRPAIARSSTTRLVIDTLDLQSNTGGHVRLVADLPEEGNGAAELSAAGVSVADVMTLLQADAEGGGTVSISASAEGTKASPRFEAKLGLADGSYASTELPVLSAALAYADKRLAGNAALARDGTTLATAEGSAPLNLALSGVTGGRLDPDGALTLDARMAELSLSSIPRFSAVIENLKGRANAMLSVRGTPKRPEISGQGSVRDGSFRAVPADVTFRDVTASAHIRGDTVVLDSLVARSEGTVRLHGTVGIESLSRPAFALTLDANDLRVLGGRSGSLHADSHLEITGPLDDLLISGTASVVDGFFDASGPSGDAINLINTGDPALYAILDTSVAPARQSGLARVRPPGNMRLDVGLRIDQNVWLRTAPDGNLEIRTAIDLGVLYDKRSGLWTFSGLVNTTGGDYTFQARRFRMARGSGSMSGTPDVEPVIQATGVHDVWLTGQEPVQLRIVISGNTGKPRITMEGNNRPPVPGSIAQSYITFSRPFTSVLQQGGSSLSGASTASGHLSGATGILARRQQASVAMGVITHEVGIGAVRSLFVDVFTVTPGEVPAEHAESRVGGISGIVVTAGKFLDPETQISVQLRPATIYPGLRFQRRFWGHLLLDLGIEPRWVSRAPFLSADQEPRTKRAFGAFLTREWEF
ncbi:MAG: translocation/assembly module TamB domain-containing protein [Gemmatimonadota bacterium]|nr:translocation/assembly module TamB domain-containing protein [Gemmatimonadota bacterium]